MRMSRSDWKKLKLDTIGAFSKGAGVSKDELKTEGISAVRYGEIYTQHNTKVKTIGSLISKQSARSSKRIKRGDILFAGSGETIDDIGKSVAYLFDDECYAGGDIVIFSPIKDDSLFLSYLLNSQTLRRELRRLGQGQSVVHLYARDLRELKVSLPSKQEQQRIVEVLETWDQYLEMLDAKIELKKEAKKGLLKNLLAGNRRLPGFSTQWSTVKIKSICTVKRGGSPRPIDSYITDEADGLNWLRIGDINSGDRYIYKTSEKIRKEGLKKTTLVHAGDFILSNSMSFGRPYIMKIDACIHDGWLALMGISAQVNKSYLYYLLSSEIMQAKFKSISAGSGVQNLKKETVSEVYISLPSRGEQDAITNILTATDDEIEMLKEKRVLAASQKQYLIDNLITGKVSTPENLRVSKKEASHA